MKRVSQARTRFRTPMTVFGRANKRYDVEAERILEERLRRSRRYRELVLKQIRAGCDPSREDLARGLLQSVPVTRQSVTVGDDRLTIGREAYEGTPAEAVDTDELLAYVVKTYIAETRQ